MDLSAIRCHLIGFFKTFIEKVKRILDHFSFTPKVCIVILTLYSLLVMGTLLGGWIGWVESEISGYILAGATGAMSGLIYFFLMLEYVIPMGHVARQEAIDYLSGLIDVIGSTLSGSFWRKWLRAMKSRVIWFVQSICWDRNMVMLLERLAYNFALPLDQWNDEENIFDACGLSEDSIANIPKITVTSNNNVDDSTSGERDLCSVCLQDFEVGETVRSLPGCHHMFHITCIDKWLTMHGSCPLCRRDL